MLQNPLPTIIGYIFENVTVNTNHKNTEFSLIPLQFYYLKHMKTVNWFQTLPCHFYVHIKTTKTV